MWDVGYVETEADENSATATLKSYFKSFVKPTNSVLDLCSSWVSHFPDDLKPGKMIGIGMNAQELAANGHLTEWYVKDLNAEPKFEGVGDESVDVVVCNVSVDYLVKPVRVFREIHRYVLYCTW